MWIQTQGNAFRYAIWQQGGQFHCFKWIPEPRHGSLFEETYYRVQWIHCTEIEDDCQAGYHCPVPRTVVGGAVFPRPPMTFNLAGRDEFWNELMADPTPFLMEQLL